MPRVFITGANRGIGLEFVKQYLADGWQVDASCRHPETANDLSALRKTTDLTIHRMDVTRASEIEQVSRQLESAEIDLLINNAGISEYAGAEEPGNGSDISQYDFEFWEDCLRVNLLGPARVTGAFLPQLKSSEASKVVMISSGLASIGERRQAGLYAYRSSKAALNMLMSGLASELKRDGITLASIAPGWTQTDMGGPHAKLSVESVVHGIRRVVDDITLQQTGSFLRWNGDPISW